MRKLLQQELNDFYVTIVPQLKMLPLIHHSEKIASSLVCTVRKQSLLLPLNEIVLIKWAIKNT